MSGVVRAERGKIWRQIEIFSVSPHHQPTLQVIYRSNIQLELKLSYYAHKNYGPRALTGVVPYRSELTHAWLLTRQRETIFSRANIEGEVVFPEDEVAELLGSLSFERPMDPLKAVLWASDFAERERPFLKEVERFYRDEKMRTAAGEEELRKRHRADPKFIFLDF